jgi:hypothetical protein
MHLGEPRCLDREAGAALLALYPAGASSLQFVATCVNSHTRSGELARAITRRGISDVALQCPDVHLRVHGFGSIRIAMSRGSGSI